MWGGNRFGAFIGLLVLALVFLMLTGRNSPVWLCFCFVPAFPLAFGWSGRRDIFEKRKRGDALDEGYDEKPKRDDPQYALGDDGELIELPPDTTNERRTDDYV
jgi:hypothetical protein